MSLFTLSNGVKLWVSFGNRDMGVRQGQIYQCESLPDEADFVLVEVGPPPTRKPTIVRNATKAVRSGCFVQCEDILPYPLEVRTADKKRRALVSVYLIPSHEQKGVLKKIWPFKEPPPLLSAWRFDIHHGEWFQVSEYLIVRQMERNFLVSPFYFESGGTVLDWFPGDPAGSNPPNTGPSKEHT